MKYFYRGVELTDVKEMGGLNYLGFDIEGYWFDPADNRNKHGFFYLKDLEVKEQYATSK
jgi:hypothetical protein